MALDDIIKKIETDSQQKIDKLKAGAETEASQIIERAKKEAEDKRHSILRKGEEEAERNRKRILQIADLEARKIILSAKRDVISDTFEQARQKLDGMENYSDLIQKMLLAGVETGEEEVVVSADDKKKIGSKLIASVNSELKIQGKKGKLSLAKDDAPITGGFILRRGKVEMDSSFTSLIKSQKDELEIKVAEILFSQSK